jgi:hypothetical protein
VSVGLAVPAAAAKPGKEFKAEIEKTVKGQKWDKFRSYAVVLENGIPIVSRFGASREADDPGWVTVHVDVVDGELSFDRKDHEADAAIDFLRRGDVVGVGWLGYGDRTVEVNLVTVKGRAVTRTDEKSRRTTADETMNAVMKFRLPAAIPDPPTAGDAGAVHAYMGRYLRFFDDVKDARAHAAGLR